MVTVHEAQRVAVLLKMLRVLSLAACPVLAGRFAVVVVARLFVRCSWRRRESIRARDRVHVLLRNKNHALLGDKRGRRDRDHVLLLGHGSLVVVVSHGWCRKLILAGVAHLVFRGIACRCTLFFTV